jgi:hypothetical protein
MTASAVRGQRASRGTGPIRGSSDRCQDRQSQRSPSPKMVPFRCAGTCNRLTGYLYLLRGSERSATPMPGDRLRSPLKELIPIDSSAGSSQDKGKGRAVEAMDEGKSESERAVSLTLGAEGVLPGRHIVSLLRVFKQFTHLIPSGQMLCSFKTYSPL